MTLPASSNLRAQAIAKCTLLRHSRHANICVPRQLPDAQRLSTFVMAALLNGNTTRKQACQTGTHSTHKACGVAQHRGATLKKLDVASRVRVCTLSDPLTLPQQLPLCVCGVSMQVTTHRTAGAVACHQQPTAQPALSTAHAQRRCCMWEQQPACTAQTNWYAAAACLAGLRQKDRSPQTNGAEQLHGKQVH